MSHKYLHIDILVQLTNNLSGLMPHKWKNGSLNGHDSLYFVFPHIDKNSNRKYKKNKKIKKQNKTKLFRQQN